MSAYRVTDGQKSRECATLQTAYELALVWYCDSPDPTTIEAAVTASSDGDWLTRQPAGPEEAAAWVAEYLAAVARKLGHSTAIEAGLELDIEPL